MGKDGKLKKFFSDKRRFADVVNGFGCDGVQCVQPEDLQEADVTEGLWEIDGESQKRTKHETRRDIVKKVAFGVNFAIVGIENQEKVDYSLPYRVMSYDVSRYGKQVAEIKKEAKRTGKKLQDGEFLYRFKKDSKLIPVVTFVLYYGEHQYDGATDLHGIIDFRNIPESVKKMIQNYQVNLIDIRQYENFDMLHTDVKTVFELIRDSNDVEKWKKHLAEHPLMEKDAVEVVNEYVNMNLSQMLLEEHTEGGMVNMCKAWDDWHADGVKAGREEGIKAGREEGIKAGREEGIKAGIKEGEHSLAIKFIKLGLVSLETAAQELGVSVEQLQQYMKEKSDEKVEVA